MSQRNQRDLSFGWVNLRVEACMGWLALTVEIPHSTLTLPEEHPRVSSGSSDALPDTPGPQQYRYLPGVPTLQGRFHITEIVGRRFEFGAYSTNGDGHDNPLTQDLLDCFAARDRKLVVETLAKLAADRDVWWHKTVAQYAAKLGKEIADLTKEDMRPLYTRGGQRSYPLFKPTAAHDTHPAFHVDRGHLETQLQLLINCILSEVSIAS